jgi:hypothetical protein
MNAGGAATVFELHAIGGPWGRRLAPRRAWLDELAWPAGGELLADDARAGLPLEIARAMWTQTAWSEYASAAAFAEIAAALLACGAPIDLVAAAGDFVVDELVHAEAAARVAGAVGGAVALEVALDRLVRPPAARAPLAAAAELIVRTCCVGEALTVPMLKLSRQVAGAGLIADVLGRIVADEASHAQLGWWFLDWAVPRLDDAARAELGRVAGGAIASFAPLLAGGCTGSGLGVVACTVYDPAFTAAVARHVVRPLAARGIEIPADALAVVGAATAARA